MTSPHLAAFALAPVSGPAPASRPASRFERREQLREQRSLLVADLARRSGDSHRDINGRVNRAVGVRAVGAATEEQLERANALLARWTRGR